MYNLKGKFPRHQIKQLQNIGCSVTQNRYQANFDRHLEELKKYKEEHWHCRVPYRYGFLGRYSHGKGEPQKIE